MKADIVTLCHSALARGNELSILGAFSIIHATSVPHVLPATALALRLIFDQTEDGTHTLQIKLMSTDGATLYERVCQVQVPPLPAHVPESLHPNASLCIVCQLPEIELK